MAPEPYSDRSCSSGWLPELLPDWFHTCCRDGASSLRYLGFLPSASSAVLFWRWVWRDWWSASAGSRSKGMALRRRSLRLKTWRCQASIGTFVIRCTWRWCVPLWDRHCSSAVSCFWSTRELCGSCFMCSCWAMRSPRSGSSLVRHTRRTERTSGGGGRGSHRGRAPAQNDRLSARGVSSVAEQPDEADERPRPAHTEQGRKRLRVRLRGSGARSLPGAFDGRTMKEQIEGLLPKREGHFVFESGHHG